MFIIKIFEKLKRQETKKWQKTLSRVSNEVNFLPETLERQENAKHKSKENL